MGGGGIFDSARSTQIWYCMSGLLYFRCNQNLMKTQSDTHTHARARARAHTHTHLYAVLIHCYGGAVFHQLWLSMEHHERVSITAPPHSEAWLSF